MMYGVLLWKPTELRRATTSDVSLAIQGQIQNRNWEQYAQGKNLERLAWGIAAAFGTAKIKIPEVFNYTTGKSDNAPALPHTIAQMAKHFATHVHNR